MNDLQRQAKREYDKKYNMRIKCETLKQYGSICACCGETHLEFLALDHIDGGGNISRRNKTNSRSGGVPYSKKLRREGYPEGYRVLCHNCNQAIGAYGYCPHQLIQKETHILWIEVSKNYPQLALQD